MMELVSQKTNSNMKIGIHQIPKSPFKFLLFTFQHVFAMFGANILVPILVNQSAGFEVIPLQVAFLCSGVGTILYLIITGFRTPIYLGSSFAFLGGMTTLYASSGHITGGFNIFFSLMLVGLVYVILAMIIYFTKKASSIKKILPPIIVGPAIILIGWSLITSAAQHSFLNPTNLGQITSNNIDLLWTLISISIVTFIATLIAMIYLKGIWKMIPILLGLVVGVLFSLLVWGIAKGVGNTEITNVLYNPENNIGLKALLNPSEWKWYPDITLMWSQNVANHTGFRIEVYLALVPLAVVTISEHIGDHINIGNLTGNDFIEGKPGLHRTLLGDGVATIVSATLGGPANTSYGENTSVISITKVASVWVIFAAAITSIGISFIAPISMLLNAIPEPVLGGVEIILYTMIGINGLRILIKAKVDMFDPKNIIIIAILVVTGLGGTIIIFLPDDVIGSQIALSGTGVGVILAMILNMILPKSKDSDSSLTDDTSYIDFTPSDFMRIKPFKKRKNNYDEKIVSNFKNEIKSESNIDVLFISKDKFDDNYKIEKMIYERFNNQNQFIKITSIQKYDVKWKIISLDLYNKHHGYERTLKVKVYCE